MLDIIAVMDHPDPSGWTTRRYRVPDTAHHTVEPGQTGAAMIPVTPNPPGALVSNAGLRPRSRRSPDAETPQAPACAARSA